ncbi:MAG: hypothetical protein WCF36_21095 [Candidatus Nanopelagicales bacterium]
MVLASAVGYLLEVGILEGWRQLLSGPTRLLTFAGILAALVSSFIWAAAHASAARRGVFVHAVADDRLPRHQGEDALLRATVAETWPRSVVMPFRPVPIGSASWEDAARSLAATIKAQVAAAAVSAPAARVVSILPGGPPHILALAGALTGRALRDSNREIRLIADDTSATASPFLEFPLGGYSDRRVDADAADKEPPEVLLLLREGDQHAVLSALKLDLRRAFGTTCARKVDLKRGCVKTGTRKVDLKHGRGTIRVREVRFAFPIQEEAAAYTEVLNSAREEMKKVKSDRILLQSQAPASLAFALGYVASQMGLTVGAFPYDPDTRSYVVGRGERDDPWLAHGFAEDEAHTLPPRSPQLARRWWAALVGYSGILGLLLPLMAATLALLLEWGLADSQSGVVTGRDWVTLAIVGFVSGVAVVLGTRWLRARLDKPRVRISANPGKFTLRSRVTPIPASALTSAAEDLASAVTRQFCDVVSGLPGVGEVSVDLGTREQCPEGDEAIRNFSFGLHKALRGTRPVPLRWNDFDTISGPR